MATDSEALADGAGEHRGQFLGDCSGSLCSLNEGVDG